MPLRIYGPNTSNNLEWQSPTSVMIYDSQWRTVKVGYVYDMGQWRVIFPDPIIPSITSTASGAVGDKFEVDWNIRAINCDYIEGYLYSGSTQTNLLQTQIVDTDETSVQDLRISFGGLENNTTYNMKLIGYSITNNTVTVFSGPVTTINVIIPTVNITSMIPNSNLSSVQINWNSTNQYDYEISIWSVSDNVRRFGPIFAGSLPSNDLTYTAFFQQQPNTQYRVELRVYSISLDTAQDIDFYTTPNIPLPSYSNFRTTSILYTSITVGWDATNYTSGVIELWNVGPSPEREFAKVGSSPLQSQSFTSLSSKTFSGLSPGTNYGFTLILNGPGGSITSDSIGSFGSILPALTARTLSITAPSEPTNFSGTAGSNGTFANFTWSAPFSDGGAPIIRYEFQRTQTSTPQENWLNLGQAFSYTASSLTPGTTYYFRVRAVNSVGAGAFSTVILTTPAPTVPGTPSGFFGISSADGTFITLYWNAPGDGGSPITTYEFQRNQSSTPGPTWLNIGNTTSWVSSSTVPGTLYYFRVRAINAVGTGGTATTTVIANTPPPPTTAPPTTAPPTTAPPTTAPPTTAPPTTKAPASLAPDTKVLTSNYGYIEAKYISVGDELVSMDIAEIPTDGSNFNVDNWSSETFTNNGLTTTIVKNIYAREIIGNMVRVNNEWFTDNHNILSEKDGVYRFTPAAYLTTEYKIFDYDVMDWVQVYDILVEENVKEIVMVLDCEPYDLFFTQNSLVYNTREYLD